MSFSGGGWNGALWVSIGLCAGCLPSLSQTAIVRGTVQDPQGNGIGGASVQLACDAEPARSTQGKSTGEGAFRFTGLLPCEFRLWAEFAGVASTSVTLRITGGEDITRELVLPSSPIAIGSVAAPGKPKFEASGIRGLIDPGGYSAPANAAAASGMLVGMADIKREAAGYRPHLSCAAEKELVNAAAKQPVGVSENRSLGEFYLDHGKYEEALPFLQKAWQADPKDHNVQLDVAEALLGLERFAEAQAELALIPDEALKVRGHRLRAKADEGLGEFRLASDEYVQLNRIQPNEQDAFNAGYEAILDGRPAEAEGIFRDALRRSSPSVSLLVGDGAAEFLEGNASAAVEPFLQAAEIDPSDPRPYPFLAKVFAVTKAQAARVIEATRRHVQRAPEEAEGLLAYASMLSASHSPIGEEGAMAIRETLRRVVELRPGLAEAHFQLGVLDGREGELVQAIREFRRALELDPSRAEVRYRLALALRKTGRTEEGDREMKVFQQERVADNSAVNADVRRFLSVVQSPQAPGVADTCSSLPTSRATGTPTNGRAQSGP